MIKTKLINFTGRVNKNGIKTPGFTLAEALTALAVIAIISAITIPILLANIDEKTWNSQRKALHARLAQAVSMLPKLSGYGTYEEDNEGAVEEDTAAEIFVAEGLSTVYNITNVCGGDDPDLTACGLPETLTTLNGDDLDFPTKIENLNANNTDTGMPNTKAIGIETANGESIAVFYNPNCEADEPNNDDSAQDKVCVNFVYDLNGSKGPNQIGKDMGFVTTLYRHKSSTAAPMPYTANASSGSFDDAAAECKDLGEDYRMPSRNELAAMFYNAKLLGITSGTFWSGSVIVDDNDNVLGYTQSFTDGARTTGTRATSNNVRCVQK